MKIQLVGHFISIIWKVWSVGVWCGSACNECVAVQEDWIIIVEAEDRKDICAAVYNWSREIIKYDSGGKDWRMIGAQRQLWCNER